MRIKLFFVILILCIIAIFTAGCIGQPKTVPLVSSSGISGSSSTATGSTGVPTVDASKTIRVKMTGSERWVDASVTNMGYNDYSFIIIVDFYNGYTKISSVPLRTETIKVGKTRGTSTNVPDGATSYVVSNVKTVFQGETKDANYGVTYETPEYEPRQGDSDAFHQTDPQVSLSTKPNNEIRLGWKNGFITTYTTIKYNDEEIKNNPPPYRTQISKTDTYSWLAQGEYDKIICKKLADNLIGSSKQGLKPYETLTNFVRTGIPTVTDINMFGVDDYAQSPAETLINGGGDGEDKSALLALLLKQEGYDVAMIRTPGVEGVYTRGTPQYIVVGINIDTIPQFTSSQGTPDASIKVGGKYLIIDPTRYNDHFYYTKPDEYLEDGQTMARDIYYTKI